MDNGASVDMTTTCKLVENPWIETPSSSPSFVAAPSSFDRLRATLHSVFIALVLATLAFIAWGGYVSRMQTLETQRAVDDIGAGA